MSMIGGSTPSILNYIKTGSAHKNRFFSSDQARGEATLLLGGANASPKKMKKTVVILKFSPYLHPHDPILYYAPTRQAHQFALASPLDLA